MILFLEPVLKKAIWGGSRLGSDFGYDIPGDDTGECWGISAHPNGDDKILSGPYEGKTLSELWDEHRELFGDLEGDRFPLLIKIIDAKDNLSIQVHPDDSYANVNENGSLGKTECWYLIDCPEDAELVVGHNAKTKEELEDMIRTGKWDAFIRHVKVKKGDFIQIDPGTVHAITAGCMIFEIQQNSDITYRVYDYDRMTNGQLRELHVDKSIDVITVPAKSTEDSVKSTANLPKNQWNQLITCGYYTVDKLDLDGSIIFEQKHPFLNMSVIDGNGTINGTSIKKGDHFILSADYGKVELEGKILVIASAVR